MTKTGRTQAAIVAVIAAAAVSGCDSATIGGGPPIVISASWFDVADNDHFVTFRSPDDGATSGVLTGTEEHDDCFDPCPIGGFWDQGRIEITILRDSGRPKFVATFAHQNPTELTFTQVGGSETFTITQ